MTNTERIQANNAELRECIELAEILPDAGGGSGDDLAKAIVDRTITEYSNSTIDTIGQYAFYKCENLTTVNIPNATTIRQYAFYGDWRLSMIHAPITTMIEDHSLYNCDRMITCNMPEVTSINNYGLAGCAKLEKAYFPKLQTTGKNCFQSCEALEVADIGYVSSLPTYLFNWASSVKEIIIRSTTVPTLANVNAFDKTPFASGGTGGMVYVPSSLIETYKTATNWSKLFTAGTCTFVALEGSPYESEDWGIEE